MGRRWGPCTRRGRRLAASSQLIGAGGDSRLRSVTLSRAPPGSLPGRANDPVTTLHARAVSPLPNGHLEPFRPSGGPAAGSGEGTYCTTL
jgi:hypothetical protein